MKSIESFLTQKYLSQRDLPKHKQIPAQYYIDWGYIAVREAQRWLSIDECPFPDNEDFLIKLEDNSIRRYKEDWNKESKKITHWRPFERH